MLNRANTLEKPPRVISLGYLLPIRREIQTQTMGTNILSKNKMCGATRFRK